MYACKQKHTGRQPGGGDLRLIFYHRRILMPQAASGITSEDSAFTRAPRPRAKKKKVRDTIHSALTCHFPPTAHSCASSEISRDTNDGDLGGQAELRISLRRARQLSQLKIYGAMPSLSSGSPIHAARQKGSLRERRKKTTKTLVKFSNQMPRGLRGARSLQPRVRSRSSDEICRVFSSRLPSLQGPGASSKRRDEKRARRYDGAADPVSICITFLRLV